MTYSLFPPLEPYRQGRLQVSPLHNLYFEESGNPKGRPVVFVHGGPGGGVTPDHRRYFDPEHYRIILFDQRGAGQSLPAAELRENTTWDLVSDMEKLREHLKLSQWHVFGGSWGSTLALAYAETHPHRVTSLALRGIFLCRQKEIDWFYQSGAGKIFPEAWSIYLQHIPENERHDMVAAYYRRLTSEDPAVRTAAARTWSVWEASCSRLIPDPAMQAHHDEVDFALRFARIECHYFFNKCWWSFDNQLLENAYKIRHIPCEIVHGRYDMVCPVENAYELHQVLPESTLHIIPDAGHTVKEPGITRALLEVMERFKSL